MCSFLSYLQYEHNKSVKATQTTTLTDVPKFQLLFYNFFVVVIYEYVDAFSCIPFTETREVSEHEVCKPIQLYESPAATQIHGTGTPGFSLRTDTPAVVPLVGTLNISFTTILICRNLLNLSRPDCARLECMVRYCWRSSFKQGISLDGNE